MASIGLQDLREIARGVFPGRPPDLAHLLCAWAQRDPTGELAALLEGTGLRRDAMAAALAPLMDAPRPEDDVLLDACIKASAGVTTGRDLLGALSQAPSHRVIRRLVAAGLDIELLRKRLDDGDAARSPGVLARHGIHVDAARGPLHQYGRNLSELARQGTFDDLSYRPEVKSIAEVLLKRNKANPMITGPAGCGKSALVQVFAREVAKGRIRGLPPSSEIWEISVGRIVGGTRYRGDLEARISEIVEALLAHPSVIAFVDEAHTLWGAGRAEGAPLDVANMLKPVLNGDTVRLIGATTTSEYHQWVERDPALARRFHPVPLAQPTEAEIQRMVTMQAEALESHHGVAISAMAVAAAIELTDEHVPHRAQPDKAVDLLDGAAVTAQLEGRGEVTVGDLRETLGRRTGRAIAEVGVAGRANLRNLGQRLKRRVIGQDQAIEQVVAVLLQGRLRLGSPGRNLGTFLFAGESGVGKTELGRAIAAEYFGDAAAILCLNMAEYCDPGAVNTLLGAPAGYQGSEREGTLIAWLQDHGSGVLLLDEIEKAHRDVRVCLLRLLDEGRIVSAKGQMFDTRQCVIVMTTNALSAADLAAAPLGFSPTRKRPDPAELLSGDFPPEFVARLDKVIVFRSLGLTQLREILKLRLREAVARLEKEGCRLVVVESDLLTHLLERFPSGRSDARAVARLIDDELMRPIVMVLAESGTEERTEIVLGPSFYRGGRPQVRRHGEAAGQGAEAAAWDLGNEESCDDEAG